MNISLDTSNIPNSYPKENYTKLANELYQKSSYFASQGFVDLPFQTETVQIIKNSIARFVGKFQTIVILGIGGSMLGVQTILDALYYKNHIKVICVDNIDPFIINQISESLEISSTIFVVQTKSGSTPETIAQFLYFQNLVEKSGIPIEEKFLFVTDPKLGYLRSLANSNPKIACLDLASNIGGRFCVLSSMGLLIMALLGLDSKLLLEGARDIINNQKPLCLELASIQYNLYKNGIDQNVLMPYSSRLATFSKWYIQLLSESIGKQFDNNGNIVNHGITPIPALGATDQHSQAQLFKEGPNNKLIILIEVKNHQSNLLITKSNIDGFEYLSNKTFEELIQAELQGTKTSLSESSKPNITLSIDKINEYSLGQLFMLFELSVAYIGEMLNINAFDQPGVERAKILAKEILSK